MSCGILTCDEVQGLTTQALLRRLIRKSADGCPALSLSAVSIAEPCAPFFKCDSAALAGPQLSWTQLLRLLTGLNANGCLSINAVVGGANCALQDLDVGQLHCTVDYLALFNPYGDMSYTGYYYEYEYSTDGGTTWVLFGGNSHDQEVSNLPGFPVTIYTFRITIRCNSTDTYKRVIYSTNLDGYPFRNFIQVKINGGAPQHVKDTAEGINYFCLDDDLEFIQPNTDFSLDVSGPDNWTTASQAFAPGVLNPGTFTALFTDISGGIGNGCEGGKQFEVAFSERPKINDPAVLCFGATIELSVLQTFDHYLWSNGATTPTITIGAGGDYWVKAWNNTLTSCKLQSDTLTVTQEPELPTLAITTVDPCYDFSDPTNIQLQTGGFLVLTVTPGFDTYDFGFSPGPDNFIAIASPGPYDCIATKNGCSVTLPIYVKEAAPDITYTTEYMGGCHYKYTLTGPNLIQANISGVVYGDISGLVLSFSNTLVIDVDVSGTDTSFVVLIDGTIGSDGCPHSLRIEQTCP